MEATWHRLSGADRSAAAMCTPVRSSSSAAQRSSKSGTATRMLPTGTTARWWSGCTRARASWSQPGTTQNRLKYIFY
nr:MAG TPA: hypothetical protein [Bacteriophage sp.]